MIPVVLFHAHVRGFDGGFVGVDVFFVISGFLITSLVVSDLERGTFSLLGFWERRARRILPALLLVVVFTLLVGWLLLLPSDYQALAESAVAQSIFSSNVYFWDRAGYFETAAELSPLLHTWSLAVEEQFYLLFPPGILLLTRFAPKLRGPLLLVVALGSFLISWWLLDGGLRDAAFYLLPSRGWELAAGALLALWAHRLAGLPRPVNESLSIFGFAMIAAAVFSYDGATAFPGTAALLPVVGTVLVILSNTARLTWVGVALSARPLVAVGLISYSLYLWHWPLLVFARYPSATSSLSVTWTSAVIAASVALAYLSWRFVETPFRLRRVVPARRTMFVAAATALVVVGAIGLGGYLADGFDGRVSELAREFDSDRETIALQTQCRVAGGVPSGDLELCRFGPDQDQLDVVSWGDSHADALLPLFEFLANENQIAVGHLSRPTCAPLLDVDVASEAAGCREFNRLMLAVIEETRPEHVVLTARWALYADGCEGGRCQSRRPAPWLTDDGHSELNSTTSRAVLEAGLRRTAETLTALGVEVWIVRQVPEQLFNVPQKLGVNAMRGVDSADEGRPLSEYLERQQIVDRYLAQLDALEGAHVLDPAALLCASGTCRASSPEFALYYDDNHLSPRGAVWIAPTFEELVEAAGE